LQNIVTDLLLGFGVKDVFWGYVTYIKEKYKVEPGFITMNMPRLVEFLIECDIDNPVVCSAINKAGYFMNPDIYTYEKTLKEKKFRPIAMSILASGAVKPADAVRYVCKQKSIQSIVFGASSKKHIAETKGLIESYS
jgi:phosphoribosylformimino-5-aminoimidazole carboxamide ribonucleotide (ProFAR) isomerase